MPELERAVAADADAILDMYTKARLTGNDNGSCDWDDTYPTVEFIDCDIQSGALFVLREDGRIIASVSLEENDFEDVDLHIPWTDVKSCYLSRLCVHPDRQGRGIGETVMNLITQEAQRQGYRATRHLASLKNPASLRLYRRMGYRDMGKTFYVDTDFIAFERLIGN